MALVFTVAAAATTLAIVSFAIIALYAFRLWRAAADVMTHQAAHKHGRVILAGIVGLVVAMSTLAWTYVAFIDLKRGL